MIRIGTAGWSIPKAYADIFEGEGTQLERYARIFDITEIDRTFYRLPRASTLQKWAESTPKNFRFSVKLHRSFTHIHKLQSTQGLEAFISHVSYLNPKLHTIVIQLPPSLVFDKEIAYSFLAKLRELFDGYLALEPRHESWRDAEELLVRLQIARVAADPSRYGIDAHPGGYRGFAYYRLHGSPKIYYSRYDEQFLRQLAQELKSGPKEQVVIFDNTASGAAIENALELKRVIDETK